MEKLENFWHNLFRKKDKKCSGGADDTKPEEKCVKDGGKSEDKNSAKIVTTSDENKENIVNENKATNDAIDNPGKKYPLD